MKSTSACQLDHIPQDLQQDTAENTDGGHAGYRKWCKACVEGRVVGSPHQLDPEKDERTLPIKSFDCAGMTQEGTDMFLILAVRDSSGSTPATCFEYKDRNVCAVRFVAGMFERAGAFVE